MNFEPYAIDQRLILATGEMQNFLVIRFPNGKETRAPIDLQTMDDLIGAPRTEPAAPRTPEPPSEPLFHETAPEPPPAEDHIVQWAELPPDVLHPYMKEALTRLGITAELPLSTLETIVGQVNERFSQEDWNDIAAGLQGGAPAPQAVQPQPPQPPPPAPAPPIGVVQWSDGRPVVPAAMNRGRTVQKDEMGYPVAQSGEVDPGELVGGGDTDEDGVGQF